MSQPARIVFVCVENSNRSQLAQAFARIHGGAFVDAYSAGSRPSGHVNPRAKRLLSERGYDMHGHVSQSLDALPHMTFDVVIGMGCGDEGCPLLKARRHEEWNIPDPRDADDARYSAIADMIEQKVQQLLASLR